MGSYIEAQPGLRQTARARDRAPRIIALRADALRLRGLAATSNGVFHEQLMCLALEIESHVRMLEERHIDENG